MEWSNEVILEFIHLYENKPVLWNPKHIHHKNRNHLNDVWLNIATEISIDVPVEVLRKKKESLMATYRNLSRKVRDSETTGSGAKDVYVPSWFAYDAIDRFIRATGKKIPSLSSEESQNEKDNENSQSEENYQVEGEEPNNEQQQTNVTLVQNAPINKRKLGPTPIEAHVAKHLKQASDALTNLTTKSQTRTVQDGPALYGQLLAVKLRRLTQRTQLILENKIDNLVFEAEMSEMDHTAQNYSSYRPPPSFPHSSTNSFLPSSPSYEPSPGPSHMSQENINVNSQSSLSLSAYYPNEN